MFRPLLLNYQNDANTLAIDDEFMVGADLLAAPILKEGAASRLVYLPVGVWYDYWTGKRLSGGSMIHAEAPLETVPLYVRGGAIVPMGPEMNYVGERADDPLTFRVFPDVNGRAETSLYEDDGVSQAYRQGAVRRTHVSYRASVQCAEIEVSAAEGSYQPAARRITIAVRTAPAGSGAVLDGQPLRTFERSGGAIAVHFPDDGKAHRIEIR